MLLLQLVQGGDDDVISSDEYDFFLQLKGVCPITMTSLEKVVEIKVPEEAGDDDGDNGSVFSSLIVISHVTSFEKVVKRCGD